MATSQSDEDALEQLLSSGDSYSAQLSKELSTLLPDPPSRSPRSASIPGPSSPSATAMPSQTIRPVMQTAPMMHPVTFVSPPAGAFWPASHQTPSRVGPSPNMQAPQQQHVMQTTLPTQPLLVPYAFVPFWTGCPLPFSPMAYPQVWNFSCCCWVQDDDHCLTTNALLSLPDYRAGSCTRREYFYARKSRHSSIIKSTAKEREAGQVPAKAPEAKRFEACRSYTKRTRGHSPSR